MLYIRILFLWTIILFGSSLQATHGPQIQFIHNNPQLGKIDIWSTLPNYPFGGSSYKVVSNLTYKEATTFMTFAKIYGDAIFSFTPAGSQDTTGAYLHRQYVLPYNTFHHLLLGEDASQNLELTLVQDAHVEGVHGRVKLRYFNGSSDAPALYFQRYGVQVAGPLNYRQASPYQHYYPNTQDWIIQNAGGQNLDTFTVPLNLFVDSTIFVMTTGYLHSGNASFKLLIVTQHGNVFEYPEYHGVLTNTSTVEKASVHIYPNPMQSELFVELNTSQTVSAEIWNLQGQRLYYREYPPQNTQRQLLFLRPNLPMSGYYLLRLSIEGEAIREEPLLVK